MSKPALVTAAPVAALPTPAPPATHAQLRSLVADAIEAARALSLKVRALEEAAGNGQWRGDLIIALEKAEASGFWLREGTRCLQASKGTRLLPVDL